MVTSSILVLFLLGLIAAAVLAAASRVSTSKKTPHRTG